MLRTRPPAFRRTPPTRHTEGLWLVVLLALVAGLVALLSPAQVAEADAAGPGRVWRVEAVDDDAGSWWVSADTGTSTVTIRVGDTVEWGFSYAGFEHDLVSRDTGTPWPEPIQEYFHPGDATFRHTFTQPGTYHYVCTLHGAQMTGVVVVEDPSANRAPGGTATVTPTRGTAPLDVHFTASGFTDPDGDPLTYAWDFGTGVAADRSSQAHAMFRYATPGQYLARLTVSDGRGGDFVQQFPIEVTAPEGGPTTPPAGPTTGVPEVRAVAAPAPGAAPAQVALSAEVTTRGTFTAYADGVATYPQLAGSATIVRSRARTAATVAVTGLAAGKQHLVHVHDRACSVENGGVHFRFDESQPFGEDNELWLPFTSDGRGRSGTVTVSQPLRADHKALSVVIHDPDNPSKRIGCADLTPSVEGLSYTWAFGDGTTGSGPDPVHTYDRPGTYLATVIVGRAGHGQHGGQASASVTVVVPGRDTSAPRIKVVGPTGTVRAARPTLHAKVTDDTGVRAARIKVTVDGLRAKRLEYVARTGKLTATPRKKLAPGRHTVKVVATDAAGNRAVKTWRFKVRR